LHLCTLVAGVSSRITTAAARTTTGYCLKGANEARGAASQSIARRPAGGDGWMQWNGMG